MSDNDLIRRGDAKKLCDKYEYVEGVKYWLDDLPAVRVCDYRVRDLIEFLEEHPDNIHFLPVDQLQILRDRISALDLTPAYQKTLETNKETV